MVTVLSGYLKVLNHVSEVGIDAPIARYVESCILHIARLGNYKYTGCTASIIASIV